MTERPKIGIGVLIIQDLKILLGKRKNSHGAHTWAPPGGHLEFGESFEDCAKREALEETGITLTNVNVLTVTNDIFLQENKHYVTIFMITETFTGSPQVREPEKCECWQWFAFDNLPDKLFLPLQNLIDTEDIFKK